jgi:hypothetical protein
VTATCMGNLIRSRRTSESIARYPARSRLRHFSGELVAALWPFQDLGSAVDGVTEFWVNVKTQVVQLCALGNSWELEFGYRNYTVFSII